MVVKTTRLVAGKIQQRWQAQEYAPTSYGSQTYEWKSLGSFKTESEARGRVANRKLSLRKLGGPGKMTAAHHKFRVVGIRA